MTEQPLTNTNTLSRLSRNGKNNASHKTYSLTEENLKLHTGMVPSSRETKAHFVLIYVDLQNQLVALEAQLRKEAEEAQEKFNASLPENTPPVIPEVIHVAQLSNSNSSQTTSTSPTDEEPTSPFPTNDVICIDEPEPSSPIEKIPSLLDSVINNRKKSQRIKNLFKKTAKKISLIIEKPPNNKKDTHFDREITSTLNVELPVPPSPSQSTLRSRNSSSHPKAPLRNIFVPKYTHNRTNSADTMHTHPTSLSSSLNNNASVQHSPLLPPLSTPNTLNFEKKSDLSLNLPFSNNSSLPSPNIEKCENDVCKSSPEHRDSGISLVTPGRRSGNHSREHSISSIFRKVGTFHAFQRDQHQSDGHRKEKNWSPFSSITGKDNGTQLLAFRYPSIHNTDDYDKNFSGVEEQDSSSYSGGAFISEFDGMMAGKQKERERSVTFDLDDRISTSDEETGLNKRKRCSAVNKNVQSTVIPVDFSRDSKEIEEFDILRKQTLNNELSEKD